MTSIDLIGPIFIILFSSSMVSAQLTAEDIVRKSIYLHDPQTQWQDKTIKIRLREKRPGSDDRLTKLKINNRKGLFQLKQIRENHQINYLVNGNDVRIKLDGQEPQDTALIRKFRLDPERVKTIRNYYTFLYGLPMKIMDPGAILDKAYSERVFNNRPAYRIRVHYNPQVGKDVWYFYFDCKSFFLIGYQFFHDETQNDGEYITLEDHAKVNKMLLPKKRNWYTNDTQQFLGTDIIEEFEQ